jgi:hypothetical protein
MLKARQFPRGVVGFRNENVFATKENSLINALLAAATQKARI